MKSAIFVLLLTSLTLSLTAKAQFRATDRLPSNPCPPVKKFDLKALPEYSSGVICETTSTASGAANWLNETLAVRIGGYIIITHNQRFCERAPYAKIVPDKIVIQNMVYSKGPLGGPEFSACASIYGRSK